MENPKVEFPSDIDSEKGLDGEKQLDVPPLSLDAVRQTEQPRTPVDDTKEDVADQIEYLHGAQLNLMVAGLTLAMVLVFLVISCTRRGSIMAANDT